MKNRLIARIWAPATCLALLGACSSSPPTRTRTDPAGAGGALQASDAATGAGGATASGAICVPSDSACGVKVVSGPTGPGSECLAMRDNASASDKHVQLRQVWTRITAPVGNTTDFVYGVLQGRAELPISTCNMRGVSGYIKLVDWDRSSADITQQTARIGWAKYTTDGAGAAKDGLCMVELEYSAPSLGLTVPWVVKPVVQKRVAADFKADDVRSTVTLGEGVFYFDEAAGQSHHYSPLEYVTIFDSAAKVTVVPLHDAEMTIRFNDKTGLNCAGAYRADALKPSERCASSAQASPPWGCAGTACPPGEGPVESTGYFLITELEQVYSSVLDSTLCVSYPGQQNSIDSGWADPATLSCSKSPKWKPSDPVNGLPNGDYCSTTHSAATPTCHDAYKSHAFAAMSGFPVQAASCHSNAVAAAKFTM